MPTDDLEREIRDLSARILEAGRRSGERAATDRIVALVRQAVGGTSGQSPAVHPPPEFSRAEPSTPSPVPPTGGVNGAGPRGERLPPYWRPR
jgi:hypothetical protein